MHEMYDAPPGMWEAIYINYAPSGLGATAYPARDDVGNLSWVPTLVGQTKAQRSAAGRLGKTQGDDNEARAGEQAAHASRSASGLADDRGPLGPAFPYAE